MRLRVQLTVLNSYLCQQLFFLRTVTILASPMVVKTPNESKMAHIVENRNYQIVIKPSCYKQKPPDNPNIPHKRLTAHTQPPSHNCSPSALSYVLAKELVSPSTPQTLGKRSHEDASGGVRPPPSDFHTPKRLTGTTYYPQTVEQAGCQYSGPP